MLIGLIFGFAVLSGDRAWNTGSERLEFGTQRLKGSINEGTQIKLNRYNSRSHRARAIAHHSPQLTPCPNLPNFIWNIPRLVSGMVVRVVFRDNSLSQTTWILKFSRPRYRYLSITSFLPSQVIYFKSFSASARWMKTISGVSKYRRSH